MKRLLMILGLFGATSMFGADPITVKLNDVSSRGPHTNIWLECQFTIHNATKSSLSTTGVFIGSPGLALKISGLDGKELKRVYANGWMNYAMNCPIIPPGDSTFKELYGPGGRPVTLFSLPDDVHIVRVQLEGQLSGSGYTNLLTSNAVEVHVP